LIGFKQTKFIKEIQKQPHVLPTKRSLEKKQPTENTAQKIDGKDFS